MATNNPTKVISYAHLFEPTSVNGSDPKYGGKDDKGLPHSVHAEHEGADREGSRLRKLR